MKIYLIDLVLLLFLLLINGYYSLIQFDNDLIRNKYYLNEINVKDRLSLIENDQYSTLQQIQSTIKLNRYTKKSIEITGLRNVFKKLNSTSFDSYLRTANLTFNQYLEQKNKTNNYVNTLLELFFPLGEFYDISSSNQLAWPKFQLKFLNLTNNNICEEYLDTNGTKSPYQSILKPNSTFTQLVSSYFSQIKILQLSFNRLRHLDRSHFQLFNLDSNNFQSSSQLEVILLNSNKLTYIRHDTFYDLDNLRYLDLSSNKLKLIHPLTFSFSSSLTLEYINLSNNMLKAVYNTPKYDLIDDNTKYNQIINTTIKSNYNNQERSLPKLGYLYLNSDKNEIECDCGLLWLYKLKNQIKIDEFKCKQPNDSTIQFEFNAIKDENFLTQQCEMPNIIVDTHNFDKSSEISLFRSLAKRWFAWTVWFDVLPVTTPLPYLMSQPEDPHNFDLLTKNNDQIEFENKLNQIEKHVFHVWRGSDAIFKCNSKKSDDDFDQSKSTIVWKTQYGYLSHLDEDIMKQFEEDNDQNLKEDDMKNKKIKYYSYKLFYKMNKLTKIHKNITVSISQRLGGKSISNFYVNENNELIVTQMRQIVAGPFVCIAINERGIQMYEYDMHIRTGVGEFFVYSLFISLFSMIIPSIIGIIICCICEYQADKNYPMTPPCYPTPQAQTPPNFDFNEWMANAASYLPNINIHETLEQVSKRLRKGMEKASVTVKSLGLTSTAYIYSMYEQSTNRWNDIKSYVPTLNVPTINLPTMRYPPVGQLANRMRMGMGNMFIQLKEFCGTSDLIHSASIVDIDIDTNASNAVGRTYIMDQFNLKQSNNSSNSNTSNTSNIASSHHNYLRFLSLLREESRKQQQAQQMRNGTIAQTPSSTITTLSMINENVPMTSALASVADSSLPTTSSGSSASTSNNNVNINNINNRQIPMLLVKLVNNNNNNNMNHNNNDLDEDSDDDDDYDDENNNTHNNSSKSIKSTKSNSSSGGTSNSNDDNNGEERTSKLEPSNSMNIIKKSTEKS